MIVSFCSVLEILDLIESVSAGFPTYSYVYSNIVIAMNVAL